ncbi:MBL fold metallo-hydrolase [Paracoccus sp. DMF-8]|uniref:MBL fold metallo-hydrolase n=1 Tax=Paracoccus sp. DMF-8 TaxID=3019445 RepID=UPI0023E82A86|nr:MBL fold metallo-hydrolase [Paracoccus sp. DMF-8]MDF3606364.1 MBL fold metallo-hydrolase [Paracoccus sp. DMF-8]
MAVLTAFSGLGGKSPAAFLLQIAGRRILLDLGEGPTPGQRPDLTGIGRVDAIFLSHAHIDHVGAIDLWPDLGRPPVFASRATFDALPLLDLHLPPHAQHELPLQGPAALLDLPVSTGRNGHAAGGIWLHLQPEGGALYMGDWSRRSGLLPFDLPPPADLVITDLSYGDRDQTLVSQVLELAARITPGTVLPVPILGRGADMAQRLAALGLTPVLCPQIRAEMQGALPGLRCIATPAEARASDVIIAADTERPGDLVARLIDAPQSWRFIFTGHVAPGSTAAALIAAGRGSRQPRNVHPRARDQIWLAETTGARHLIPAFGALDAAPGLTRSLAAIWHSDRTCP